MLARLPILAVPLLALMGQLVSADITLKLNTHPKLSAPSPRAFKAGRSRPRRLDSAHHDAGAHDPREFDTRSEVASAIPLHSHDSGGVAYTVVIEVAGTALPVLVDTGSSQLWVASQDCPTCADMDMIGVPLPTSPECGIVELPYISGHVFGCKSSQEVVIGSYRLPAQTVVAARELTGALATSKFSLSGILGLGRGSADGFGVPFVQHLKDSGQVDSATVGFYLNRDWQTGGTGELIFGDVTKSSHIDVTKSVRLPSTDDRFGMYHVHMDSIKSGQEEVVPERTVIIDTGATNIAVPESFLPGIYLTLDPERMWRTQNGRYYIPCTKAEGVDDLVMTFGGQDWSIEYQDLVGGAVPGRNGSCWGNIDPTTGSDTGKTWIGAVFLTNVYSAFDASDGSVTFYGLK